MKRPWRLLRSILTHVSPYAINDPWLIDYNSPAMWRLVRQSRARRHLRDTLITYRN